MKVPMHELSNYRIALRRYREKWASSKDGGKRLWDILIGNAMRLAEAVDRIEAKESMAGGKR